MNNTNRTQKQFIIKNSYASLAIKFKPYLIKNGRLFGSEALILKLKLVTQLFRLMSYKNLNNQTPYKMYYAKQKKSQVSAKINKCKEKMEKINKQKYNLAGQEQIQRYMKDYVQIFHRNLCRLLRDFSPLDIITMSDECLRLLTDEIYNIAQSHFYNQKNMKEYIEKQIAAFLIYTFNKTYHIIGQKLFNYESNICKDNFFKLIKSRYQIHFIHRDFKDNISKPQSPREILQSKKLFSEVSNSLGEQKIGKIKTQFVANLARKAKKQIDQLLKKCYHQLFEYYSQIQSWYRFLEMNTNLHSLYMDYCVTIAIMRFQPQKKYPKNLQNGAYHEYPIICQYNLQKFFFEFSYEDIRMMSQYSLRRVINECFQILDYDDKGWIEILPLAYFLQIFHQRYRSSELPLKTPGYKLQGATKQQLFELVKHNIKLHPIFQPQIITMRQKLIEARQKKCYAYADHLCQPCEFQRKQNLIKLGWLNVFQRRYGQMVVIF